jgi:SulP family sulfate permease
MRSTEIGGGRSGPAQAADEARRRGAAGRSLSLASLKGDLAGGVTAAILTIPVSMGYGLLALYPLGDRFASYGILAGLLSAIFVPLTAVLLGTRAALMYAPRSVITFLIASLVLGSVAHGPAAAASGDVRSTLAFVFFIIVAAGLFQALLGALRLGGLVRYIPSPVMAGFQNAVAVLIFVSQLHAMLGVPRSVPLAQVAAMPSLAQPLTLAVGILTCAVIWWCPRLTKRVPPTIAGLSIGTGAYWALSALGYGPGLGRVVGPMPSTVPTPAYLAGFGTLLIARESWSLIPALLVGAFSLAIVGSLDALLCLKMVEGVTGQKSNSSRELVRLGLGNMVAACFGGIASGVNLGSSLANHKAGGRTCVSSVVSASVILLAILFVGPVIAFLPRVVIAATLVIVAIQLVDRWSLHLFRRAVTGELVHWKVMTLDLLVVALVAAVTIAFDLVTGVAVGVAVTIVFFLVRMSKSVVRRTYHGDMVRSHRTRDPRLMELLAAEGRQIVVFELEGPIFFGTAEDLANRVEAAGRGGARSVVFDLKRVNELDSTGAQIILQIHGRLKREGRHLLVSHLHDNPTLANVLTDMRVTAALGQDAVFADTDGALEWAEDQVILAHGAEAGLRDEVGVDRLAVLTGLTEDECALVKTMLVRRTYRTGEAVIREGSEERDLFMMSRGTVSVKVGTGPGRQKRLASFSAGAVFGEIALLDEQPRSATIVADDDVVCYVLPEEAFRSLVRNHQSIAITLLRNLGRELSQRLRRANATISQLEG